MTTLSRTWGFSWNWNSFCLCARHWVFGKYTSPISNKDKISFLSLFFPSGSLPFFSSFNLPFLLLANAYDGGHRHAHIRPLAPLPCHLHYHQRGNIAIPSHAWLIAVFWSLVFSIRRWLISHHKFISYPFPFRRAGGETQSVLHVLSWHSLRRRDFYHSHSSEDAVLRLQPHHPLYAHIFHESSWLHAATRFRRKTHARSVPEQMVKTHYLILF